jgi:spiro-SPASM protein
MGYVAVINAIALSPYAFKNITSEKTAFQLILEYASALESVDEIHVFTDGNLPQETAAVSNTTIRSDWTLKKLLEEMKSKGKGKDGIVYVFGDCPLLDTKLTERMMVNHNKYLAEYSFADGFPYGLSPEILRPELIPSLISLLEKADGIRRDSIFSIIQKDINAFDIETEISQEDLRLLRAFLCCDSKRNYLLTRRVIENGGQDEVSVFRVLKEKPEILRTLPAYVQLQIMGGCPQACSYCPFPRFGGDVLKNREYMDLESYKTAIKKVLDFCEDVVIGISMWGEPALHPQISEIIRETSNIDGVRLVIETSGIGWDEAVIAEMEQYPESPADWIFSLDAMDSALYKKLRGNGMEEAFRTAKRFAARFPGHVFFQAVRMKANEEHLESFYRTMKEGPGKVIIQKYDHFCEYLSQEKITDLSPVHRFPCWHIKRDLCILLDGTVPLCREDMEKKFVLGNIFTDSMEDIWSKGESYYTEHIKRQYNILCERCDEYYTYNF